MIEACAVVVCIGIYFLTLSRGFGSSSFDWVKFWAFLGMFAVFFVGFELPLIFAHKFQTDHPGWFFLLMLGGIFAFVMAITMWGLKRKQRRAAALGTAV